MDEFDKEVPLDNPEMDIPEMEGIPQETGTDETIPTPVGEADEGDGHWITVGLVGAFGWLTTMANVGPTAHGLTVPSRETARTCHV